MAYSRDIESAKALATRMHEGQIDKAGLPYITHPQRVAGRLDSPEAQVVGWLHDTVEDTSLTVEDIARQFGPETAAAVDAVSRREGESWGDYLDRVQVNPIAGCRVPIRRIVTSAVSPLAKPTIPLGLSPCQVKISDLIARCRVPIRRIVTPAVSPLAKPTIPLGLSP